MFITEQLQGRMIRCPMPSNVVNLPQSCHNVPQPPQRCMADTPRLRLLGQDIKQK